MDYLTINIFCLYTTSCEQNIRQNNSQRYQLLLCAGIVLNSANNGRVYVCVIMCITVVTLNNNVLMTPPKKVTYWRVVVRFIKLRHTCSMSNVLKMVFLRIGLVL